MNAALCLVGYGLAVALLAPPWLARAASGGRAPRLAMAAWLLGIATTGASLLAGAAGLARSSDPWLAGIGWLALAGVPARAGWAAATTFRGVRARRTSHRELVALLGRPDSRLGAVIVDAPEPLIYCLPTPEPTVVVTTAARRALSPVQLRAALAHERAHLAGRHHLLLAVMRAGARAFPWLALFTRAESAVAGLLEMRADDVAARRYGRRTVARAIAAMGTRPPIRRSLAASLASGAALGMTGVSALSRGLRLCSSQPTWRVYAHRAALTTTVLLLALGPYLSAELPICPHPWW